MTVLGRQLRFVGKTGSELFRPAAGFIAPCILLFRPSPFGGFLPLSVGWREQKSYNQKLIPVN